LYYCSFIIVIFYQKILYAIIIIIIYRYVTGHFDIIAEDLRGTWDLIGHVVNDTWIVEHFGVNLSVGNLKVNFDTFLEENKGISTY